MARLLEGFPAMAHDPPERVPDDLFEAAAAWFARMREPSVGDEDRAAFARWLAADPRHRPAWEEAARLWHVLAAPVAAAATIPPDAAPARRRLLRPLALAASLLMAVAAGAIWGPAVRDDLRADHRTAAGERRTVALADGSRVTLNTETALAIDFDGGRRRVRLFRGEAFFDVAVDPSRPFRVETPAGAVRVVGTRFNVRLGRDRVAVSVLEGQVAAAPASAWPEVPVASGEEILLSADGASAPRPFDLDGVTGWRRGRLVFYRASLADVVGELERYRGGRIFILGGRIRDLRVTGAFDTARADAALDIVAATLPIEVTRLPLGIVLLH